MAVSKIAQIDLPALMKDESSLAILAKVAVVFAPGLATIGYFMPGLFQSLDPLKLFSLSVIFAVVFASPFFATMWLRTMRDKPLVAVIFHGWGAFAILFAEVIMYVGMDYIKGSHREIRDFITYLFTLNFVIWSAFILIGLAHGKMAEARRFRKVAFVALEVVLGLWGCANILIALRYSP